MPRVPQTFSTAATDDHIPTAHEPQDGSNMNDVV